MSGHTPGPWVVKFHNGHFDEPRYVGSVVRNVARVIPSTLESHASRARLDRANARLIAAAPEMLEALRMAEPVLREAVIASLLPLDDLSDRIALDAVEAAIAKATEDDDRHCEDRPPQPLRRVPEGRGRDPA